MLRTPRSLEAYCVTLWWRRLSFSFFLVNGAPVYCNWQGKPEVLGEKPVPVPLCPSQILHGLTLDWTRAFAVTAPRLTAWAMVRPFLFVSLLVSGLRMQRIEVPEDGSRSFLRNVWTLLPDYTASYLARQSVFTVKRPYDLLLSQSQQSVTRAQSLAEFQSHARCYT
jgi:hypothetical protein